MSDLIEFVKSIGWPQAALLFAFVFIGLFRKELRSFLGRVRSVGKDGVVTDDIPKPQSAESKTKAVDDLMRSPDSLLLNEVETTVLKELRDRGLETSSDAVKVLARRLAATVIALEFEQVYNTIFGSQIYLLKKLNEFLGVGVDQKYVLHHYEHVQKMFSEAFGDWTLDRYLGFLNDRKLIRMDLEKYSITVRGAEFLLWLVRMGRSEKRNL